MSRSRKFDDRHDDVPRFHDDYMDLEDFFDSMVERSTRRRDRRKFNTRQHLADLEEKRWLRQQLDDWGTETIH